MKILHTADWHMNTKLGRHDLTPHIFRALEQIAAYLEAEGVDVLLVAGDLFSERSDEERITRALHELQRIFGPFVARGGTILSVAGNHDHELRFEGMRHLLALGNAGTVARFDIRADPGFVALRGTGGETVQFVLMPFPTPRAYGRDDGQSAAYSSFEERNRALQERFSQTLQRIREQHVQAHLPTVLVSHIHVRGASGHTLFKVTESEEVVFDPNQIPSDFAYCAYGHIHKPGPAVAGNDFIRYSGSPIALDLAERHDHKSCVLLEIDEHGVKGDVRLLPLQGPHLHKLHVDATSETPESFVARLKEEVGDDLAWCELRFDPRVHSLPVLRSALERALPNIYSFQAEEVGSEVSNGPIALSSDDETGASTNALSGDPAAIVREFLGRRLQNHEDQTAILALAEELMANN